MKTLEETKSELSKQLEKGAICECCGQFAKLYTRSITSAMAMALIVFTNKTYEKGFDRYVHVENFFKNQNVPASIRGDFPKLRFWNLIKPDKEREGFYCATLEGYQFVNNEILVQSHVRIYNNKTYGFRGDLVAIQHCLKNKFDYDKLMDNTL